MNSKMFKKLLSLLTVFALVVGMIPAMGIAASAEADNLLVNGDFETTGTWVDQNSAVIGQQQEVAVTTPVYTNDFSGAAPLHAWNVNSTTSAVVEKDGNKVLSFAPGTNAYITYYGMSSLVVGDDYILRCKVYTDTEISFRLYDNATGKNMHKTAPAGQWTEYTVNLTATANATTLYFGFMNGTTGTVCIDDVAIEHVEKENVAVPLYSNDFSGASPLLAWNYSNTTSSVIDLDGNKVLSFAPGTNKYVTYYGMNSLVVGKEYVMSCKIYCDTNVYFRLLEDATNMHQIKTAMAGQWTEYTASFTASKNKTTLYFGIMDSNAGPVYIDDVCIAGYELQNATSYSDGIGNCGGTEESNVLAMSANKQISQPVALTAGNTYSYSFDVKGSSAALNLLNGDQIAVSEEWNTVTGSFIADAGDVSFGFACTAGSVLLDNVRVWQSSTAQEVTISFNQVTQDGTWQLSMSSASDIPTGYYKVSAEVDGAVCDVLTQYNGNILIIYPAFFTALPGGVKPAESLIIAQGAVMIPMELNNGWKEVVGGTPLTVTEKLDVSCVNGVWDITVPNVDSTMTFNQVTADNGTWQFAIGHTPADKYYKFAAVVDGNACDVAVGEAGGVMCIYPSFFFGNVPVNSFKIAAGTVMYPVDPIGWQKITGATTVTLTNDMMIEYANGTWIDMSDYDDVNFAELTAADLDVYKFEDQAESQYRSTFAISSKVAIGNAGWADFTKIAGKVLVDDVAVSAVFGMVPANDGWGQESAFMLYITGEGYRDAATSASKITICKDTMLISPLDATRGFKFTEDFNMYKNCDGTWDTTPDTHVFDQQNTELEGALATNANCMIAAQYYYSCVCGVLGDKTFESGELGDHNYVNGTCQHCFGTAQEMTLSLQVVAPGTNADGSVYYTWRLDASGVPENTYYKVPVLIDGSQYHILIQYHSGEEKVLIYDNFFTALGGKYPAESVVIPAGTVLTPVKMDNGWKEIDGATAIVVTEELQIENIYDKWYEMSKYADLTFTEIYAADLDLYYSNILRLGDYSDWQIEIAKKQYPQYADMIDHYGRDANMTTFGIKSTIPTLQIPNHQSWPNFSVIGKITVNGAEPWETYVMQTRDSSDDGETAMDSAFLVRFYNGFVADQAASITIEPGTMIVTNDGSAGFVFVDGYTIYRGDDGTWSETAPEGTNPVQRWNLILGDDIGVKFQINTNEAVSFTVNGTAVEAVQNGNYYTINVAAAQMNDTITVYVGGVALEKTYTVRGYADVILADELYGEEAHALVKAMLVYGAAAQRYFDHNAGNPADDNITVTPVVPTGEATMAISGSVDGIRFYGASLVHRSKTAIRFYFAGNTADLTFKVGEDTYHADAKGDLSYIEVAGIDPHELGNAVTVVVSDGVDTLSVTYSALDYMIRMYNKGGEPIQALVQAMYGYYKAAVTYTA